MCWVSSKRVISLSSSRSHNIGALKPGFRRLATRKVVVNVVGELYTEKNSYGIARFPRDSTAFLFSVGCANSAFVCGPLQHSWPALPSVDHLRIGV